MFLVWGQLGCLIGNEPCPSKLHTAVTNPPDCDRRDSKIPSCFSCSWGPLKEPNNPFVAPVTTVDYSWLVAIWTCAGHLREWGLPSEGCPSPALGSTTSSQSGTASSVYFLHLCHFGVLSWNSSPQFAFRIPTKICALHFCHTLQASVHFAQPRLIRYYSKVIGLFSNIMFKYKNKSWIS